MGRGGGGGGGRSAPPGRARTGPAKWITATAHPTPLHAVEGRPGGPGLGADPVQRTAASAAGQEEGLYWQPAVIPARSGGRATKGGANAASEAGPRRACAL